MKLNTIKEIIYCIIIFFGIIGLLGMLIEAQENVLEKPVASFTAFIGLIILGSAGIKTISDNYKGGFSTVIGAFIIYFGLLCLVIGWEIASEEGKNIPMLGSLLFAIIVAIGMFLVRLGRKKYIRSKFVKLSNDEVEKQNVDSGYFNTVAGNYFREMDDSTLVYYPYLSIGKGRIVPNEKTRNDLFQFQKTFLKIFIFILMPFIFIIALIREISTLSSILMILLFVLVYELLHRRIYGKLNWLAF